MKYIALLLLGVTALRLRSSDGEDDEAVVNHIAQRIAKENPVKATSNTVQAPEFLAEASNEKKKQEEMDKMTPLEKQ